MQVVCDIETDSLNPTKIWIIVAQDVQTKEIYKFVRPDLNPLPFIEFAVKVKKWIGHHFLTFDAPVLRKFFPTVSLPPANIIDTLIISRTLNYPIVGGHGLDAWAVRFGLKKPTIDDFTVVDPAVIENRCVEDVKINTRLWEFFQKWMDGDFKEAILIEHKVAELCRTLSKNGFYFEKEKADDLYWELCQEERTLLHQLQSAFPPEEYLDRTYIPRTNQDGTINRSSVPRGATDLTIFTPGVPYHVYKYTDFNPGSPKQVVKRLNEAGWAPTAKTKGHIDALADKSTPKEKLAEYAEYGWKVNEENLETLSETAPDAAHKLVQWLLINNRKSRLEEWFGSYNETTHRIHGQFLHIGAWTHRMSHQAPNMGNVPSVDSKYNGKVLKQLAKQYGIQLRSLWSSPQGRQLIGVDADSIQLRVLAHYMNDATFTEALINGDKDKGTDAHTLNALKLGFDASYRPKAKTFIYAFLLGAGIAKVATILGISIPEAKDRLEMFIKAYPGLEDLKKKRIPYDANKGYFVGFDGRLVPCKSTHLMLAGYLQNGEACVMKHGLVHWSEQADREKLDYLLVNFVHDEWDTEVQPSEASYLAHLQADSIRLMGEKFKLNCPMAGSIKGLDPIGKNWYDVH